jgi:hypothetical protein
MWKWLIDYFDLRRGERRGIAVLLGLILMLIISQFLVKYVVPKRAYDFTEIKKISEEFNKNKLQASNSDTEFPQSTFDLEKEAEYTLFPFDPNSLDEIGFTRLGAWTVS